jgi:hypothetical protein
VSGSGAIGRDERMKAFVPELIPEPKDIVRNGPLDPREERDLDRIHRARDHHAQARWMRGKALAAAIRRSLYRGADGTRTVGEYLDEEWDGISESAAYREIKEWPLAAQIDLLWKRSAPDSHVRALVDVAEEQGNEHVAKWYTEVRRHGQEHGHRVTAAVVDNLARYLRSGESPELAALFAPRRLTPPAARKPEVGQPSTGQHRHTKDPIEGTIVSGGGLPNLEGIENMSERAWCLGPDHTSLLTAWITRQARELDIAPSHAADLLLSALTAHTDEVRDMMRGRM